MRLTVRWQRRMAWAKTQVVREVAGGVARVESVNRVGFTGTLCPPKKRLVRSESGMRVAESWTVLPQQALGIHEGDHIYMQGDARCYRVSGVRVYPRHQEIDMELAP
ncbi:MAG: hypothetical protein PHP02_06045 [Eubacteriales bacterium]|nr:hypothetical protein [Eubacteriales bacterium]